MKRVYCFTVFILLLCLPTFLSAQLPKGVNIPVGKTTQGEPDNQRFTISEECELTYNFRLAVFNLDILNGENYSNYIGIDNSAPNLSLPEEYGPMILWCELNGIVHVVEVDLFSFVSLTNGGYAFVFDHSITIDVSEDCEGEEPSSELDYTVSMTLVNDSGDYYPICDYTAFNDLFDCNYFPTSCPIYHCSHEDWAQWDDILGFTCGDDCAIPDPQPPTPKGNDSHSISGGNSNIQTRNFLEPEDEISRPLEIYPNPFYTELNIKWNNSSENSMIRLYNSNSQLIKSWNNSRHEGEVISKISTNELPKGVYFLIVQSEGKATHHKLVKT